jgi:hypothetical protein
MDIDGTPSTRVLPQPASAAASSSVALPTNQLARRFGNSVSSNGFWTKLKIMSWNIERLGDTGPLGRHGGVRPMEIIESIAQIIHEADVHICAVIEVFTQDKGKAEMVRILDALQILDPDHEWQCALSDGPGTGGLSLTDGSEHTAREGYAILYRSVDLEVASGKWLDIFDGNRSSETKNGLSHLRDAFEFQMTIRGDGELFKRNGEPLHFPIAVFHAPGPRGDPQRQADIKLAISGLFTKYLGNLHTPTGTPNAFICADFNASEDADNLIGDKADKDVDYSFGGNLLYMASINRQVALAYRLRSWADQNPELVELAEVKDTVAAIVEYIESPEFEARCIAVQADEDLEMKLDRLEYWFANHPRQAKLSGIAAAKRSAKLLLNKIFKAQIKASITEEQFAFDKARYLLWKAAANAVTHEAFSDAYWAVEDVDGADFLGAIAQPHNWLAVQIALRTALRIEFEDEDKLLASRSVGSYTSKVEVATLKSVAQIVGSTQDDAIEDAYDAAFGIGADAGFFDSSSYDADLRTTRRKKIHLTGLIDRTNRPFVANKSDGLASVLYSKYDQVLSRTDGKRLDEPQVETISVLDHVLPRGISIDSSAFDALPASQFAHTSTDRLLIKVCTTAHTAYAKALPIAKAGLTSARKNDLAAEACVGLAPAGGYCCQEECITSADLNWLHRMQYYLDQSHAISDHEPVVMTASVASSSNAQARIPATVAVAPANPGSSPSNASTATAAPSIISESSAAMEDE